MTTIHFFAFLTGDDVRVLQSCSPTSRKKIMVLGTGMLIPVVIWLINGFAIARNNFDLGLIASALVGCIAATIVFFFERLIIMSNSKGFWINTVRIVAGICLAIIGSVFLDEILFEKDITLAMHNAKILELESIGSRKETQLRNDAVYQKLQADCKAEQQAFSSLQYKVLEEMDGGSPGAAIGYGRRAKAKENLMNQSGSRLEHLKAELNVLDQAHAEEIKKATEETEKKFSDKSLLKRMEAFFGMVLSSYPMLFLWIVFFLLACAFEIASIIAKYSFSETDYDKKLAYLQYLQEKRMEILFRPVVQAAKN